MQVALKGEQASLATLRAGAASSKKEWEGQVCGVTLS